MNMDLSDRKPSLLVRRTRGAKRILYWHLSSLLPIILAAEFPKSGGTWIARMIAAAAGYRFPRNLLSPNCWNAVLLGHHTYSPLYSNVFVIFRDGRDVMVSAYHHFLFENEWNDPRAVVAARRDIGCRDSDEPYARFDQFVEWMFTGYCRRVTRFSWAEFARSWIDRDVPKVYYEDMLVKPVDELQRLCLALGVESNRARLEAIVEENSFKAQSIQSQVQGGVASFARKGISGDWKNVFNGSSAEVFHHFAGPELIALGYEKDGSWTGSVDENRRRSVVS